MVRYGISQNPSLYVGRRKMFCGEKKIENAAEPKTDNTHIMKRGRDEVFDLTLAAKVASEGKGALMLFRRNGNLIPGALIDIVGKECEKNNFRPYNLPDILVGQNTKPGIDATRKKQPRFAFVVHNPTETEYSQETEDNQEDTEDSQEEAGKDGVQKSMRFVREHDHHSERDKWTVVDRGDFYGEQVWYGSPSPDKPSFRDAWNLRGVLFDEEDSLRQSIEDVVLLIDTTSMCTVWKCPTWQPEWCRNCLVVKSLEESDSLDDVIELDDFEDEYE